MSAAQDNLAAYPALDVGGSAFPSHGSMGEVVQDGMTLRDYFAGQALAGISAHVAGAKARDGETQEQADARWCYERADAMLKARAS